MSFRKLITIIKQSLIKNLNLKNPSEDYQFELKKPDSISEVRVPTKPSITKTEKTTKNENFKSLVENIEIMRNQPVTLLSDSSTKTYESFATKKLECVGHIIFMDLEEFDLQLECQLDDEFHFHKQEYAEIAFKKMQAHQVLILQTPIGRFHPVLDLRGEVLEVETQKYKDGLLEKVKIATGQEMIF